MSRRRVPSRFWKVVISMTRQKTFVVVLGGILLLASLVAGDAQETLRAGGVVEPDPKIQDALKRLMGKDRLSAVDDLAKLSGAWDPDDKVQRRARRHLAEQLFLFAVREKWAVQGYDLYLIKNAMRILQGTLYVRNSDYVIAAAPNIGHEDRSVAETATAMLGFLDAFTPVKDRSGGPYQYHFRELEHYLEHVRKLGLAPEEAAERLILGMYREDPEAALNTMVRMTRRAAKTDEQRRALPDLRGELEWVARVRFALSAGPESNAAKAMRPTARECIDRLATSPHWYARLYVPYIFLQDDAFIDAQLLDRLADDPHRLVRQAVREVRDAWQRREAEKAERAAEQAK